MWHRESLGRNIFLGEVEVPLDTWDWASEATWLPLRSRVRQLARVGRSPACFPPAPPPGSAFGLLSPRGYLSLYPTAPFEGLAPQRPAGCTPSVWRLHALAAPSAWARSRP